MQDAQSATLQARATAAAHKQTRVQHSASTLNQQAQRQRNQRGFKRHTTEGQTKNRPRTTQTTENMEAKKPIHQSQRIKPPRHDRAIFQTAKTHQDVQNPRDCRLPITTHRHPTSRRRRLPSLQSRENHLDRNQQDTTRKDSTRQRNLGNVATETHSQG